MLGAASASSRKEDIMASQYFTFCVYGYYERTRYGMYEWVYEWDPRYPHYRIDRPCRICKLDVPAPSKIARRKYKLLSSGYPDNLPRAVCVTGNKYVGKIEIVSRNAHIIDEQK